MLVLKQQDGQKEIEAATINIFIFTMNPHKVSLVFKENTWKTCTARHNLKGNIDYREQ